MNLAEYVRPPVERPAAPICPACRAFGPECLVPAEAVGKTGAPIGMCWLCAHAVVDHGGTLEDAHERAAACHCKAEAIFPLEVLARRRPVVASGELEVEEEVVETRDARVRPRMSARERQDQNRAAASRTAAARLARRGARVDANRRESADLPET